MLRAAQRYVRQFPGDRLVERAIDNRDRSIRLLSHHVFRIGEAFLETAIDGVEYRTNNANIPPAEGTCTEGEEIAAYGDGIVERLENWWARLEDPSCREPVKTFYGMPPMHQLQRSTWHSAQHTPADGRARASGSNRRRRSALKISPVCLCLRVCGNN